MAIVNASNRLAANAGSASGSVTRANARHADAPCTSATSASREPVVASERDTAKYTTGKMLSVITKTRPGSEKRKRPASSPVSCCA